jgi:hypothetical protein
LQHVENTTFYVALSTSCPGWSRASASFFTGGGEDVDGRNEPGRDDELLSNRFLRSFDLG